MVERLFLILFSFGVFSCSVKTKYINEGVTKIPADENYFKRKFRDKYMVSIPNNIVVNSVYREVYSRYGESKYEANPKNLSLLKFYKNGGVNFFIGVKMENIDNIDLNPDSKGYRGIAYAKNDKQFVSFFAPVSQGGRYGLQHNTIMIANDTLYLKHKNENTTTVFVKSKNSFKNEVYNADW